MAVSAIPDSRHGWTATKVLEVTLGLWLIKIAATTLGETGGDSVTMTLGILDRHGAVGALSIAQVNEPH